VLFAPTRGGAIAQVSATTGGEPTPVTRLTSGQLSHRFPQILPDGRHFLFEVIEPGGANGATYVSAIDGGDARRVFEQSVVARYMSPGYLLFGLGGRLLAQPFEVSRLQLSGAPIPVADSVARILDPGSPIWSVSDVGHIAYRSPSGVGQRQLTWLDRSGTEIGKVGELDPVSIIRNISISPDGRQIALRRNGEGDSSQIWIMDAHTGYANPLTNSGGSHNYPVWSPHGDRLVFGTNPKNAGVMNLYQLQLINGNREELVLKSQQISQPEDWSSDGQFVVYRTTHPGRVNDLWAVSMQDDHKTFPIIETAADEKGAQFAPDAHWIAFESNETGSYEIYVQRFPVSRGKKRVSSNGGAQVRWRHDGKELFYIALDGRLMAVPIRLPSTGDDVEAGPPIPLFATRVGGPLQGNQRQQYAVTDNPQRFLMDTLTEDSRSTITVVLNWKPAL
jgi:dipeptidyl aminopeptidase/acylaminoacyl peptidase